MREPYEVIIAPVVTEKSTDQMENNTYSFVVARFPFWHPPATQTKHFGELFIFQKMRKSAIFVCTERGSEF